MVAYAKQNKNQMTSCDYARPMSCETNQRRWQWNALGIRNCSQLIVVWCVVQ